MRVHCSDCLRRPTGSVCQLCQPPPCRGPQVQAPGPANNRVGPPSDRRSCRRRRPGTGHVVLEVFRSGRGVSLGPGSSSAPRSLIGSGQQRAQAQGSPPRPRGSQRFGPGPPRFNLGRGATRQGHPHRPPHVSGFTGTRSCSLRQAFTVARCSDRSPQLWSRHSRPHRSSFPESHRIARRSVSPLRRAVPEERRSRPSCGSGPRQPRAPF
ncbi:hypothetical protein NDU88_001218 [Pleurodeles waltl]|uniref:Uncharacterized protein n=1 Tax=Pleurodeles waltl TaxID=8319 RepID=A0AAV7US65_PLEWA|nr:hypothetical protein NDU88_001218 [Pleurodeles waltl]